MEDRKLAIRVFSIEQMKIVRSCFKVSITAKRDKIGMYIIPSQGVFRNVAAVQYLSPDKYKAIDFLDYFKDVEN